MQRGGRRVRKQKLCDRRRSSSRGGQAGTGGILRHFLGCTCQVVQSSGTHETLHLNTKPSGKSDGRSDGIVQDSIDPSGVLLPPWHNRVDELEEGDEKKKPRNSCSSLTTHLHLHVLYQVPKSIVVSGQCGGSHTDPLILPLSFHYPLPRSALVTRSSRMRSQSHAQPRRSTTASNSPCPNLATTSYRATRVYDFVRQMRWHSAEMRPVVTPFTKVDLVGSTTKFTSYVILCRG
ncbi:hypothetical protein K505DRAFT_340204 [Melanomma pulvis-pyrius CBS 109.77]|uniref:Uncharacterized protein n=1 Tax=Melanomma pulvis-pyrius CBS 109.77 TaxID=1314802 RepID=A0A6A6X3K9_9PLEO|nr:hypothetical protein K505DRAFT_340204 [Melanomma pulvis-pyrius CBS 109.77]